jgi:hypothetical protein
MPAAVVKFKRDLLPAVIASNCVDLVKFRDYQKHLELRLELWKWECIAGCCENYKIEPTVPNSRENYRMLVTAQNIA